MGVGKWPKNVSNLRYNHIHIRCYLIFCRSYDQETENLSKLFITLSKPNFLYIKTAYTTTVLLIIIYYIPFFFEFV
jgi:hypothetical protein